MTDEEIAIEELKGMTPEELKKVPADSIKWGCCVDNCKRFTTIKDLGIYPLMYWRKRWIDVNRVVYYCGEHWKIYKKTVGFKCGK